MIGSIDIATVVALLLGAASVIRGSMAATGSWRGFARWYEDPTMPVILRHGAFGLFPFGIGMILLAAMSLADRGSPIYALRAVVLFITVDVFILTAVRPPEFLKPHWVREQDKEHKDAPRLHGLDRMVLTFFAVTTLVGAFVMLALWIN